MSDKIKAQIDKINKAFDDLPDLMQQAGKKALSIHGREFIRWFTKKRLTGRPGLKRRTGSLARSFKTNVLELSGAMVLMVWTTSKYARIHEFGGIVTPKKSKYLAIPTNAALTKAGATRYASPRNVPGLSFMQRKGGLPFMGKVEGGRVRAYFLLRKRVKIPPRLELGKSWTARGRRIPYLLGKVAENVLSTRFEKVR